MPNPVEWVGLAMLLLALPFLLGVLSDALRTAPEVALALSRTARANAWLQATNGGTLSPPHVATVTAGGLLMSAAFVSQLILGFYLLAPVLGPILGLPSTDLDPEFLSALGRGAIGVLLIVPVVSGVFLADIAGYGRLTPASYIRSRKMPLFFLSLAPFVGSLFAVGAAGLYRGAIMLEPYLGGETAERYAALLGAYVVFSADALVVFGIALSAIGIEPLIRIVLALVLAAAALFLAVASPLLRVLGNMIDAVSKAASTAVGKGRTAGAGMMKRVTEFVNAEDTRPSGPNGRGTEIPIEVETIATYSSPSEPRSSERRAQL